MSALRVAAIIGGGSGMGAASARRLRAAGFEIAILSSSGKGVDLAIELGGWGVQGSNQSDQDLHSLVDGCVSRWGRLDALVNSAGHGPKGDLLALTDEDWISGFQMYCLNVVRSVRAVTQQMASQGGGAIVNISSFSAVEPDGLFPTSSVARAGLAAFTKLYADTYAKAGIRMNNVLPGFIDSLLEKPERVQRIPMNRYGKAAEVAELVAYLASDKSAYVTGQNIRIDGALTRSV
ncbi:SDR family oxidoreductase [Paraburkholderia susongensis]|uniref:NAD(P)-dependent dehydrogenase, short-chain alcohol dehydrogenase family n=1 Tax=Paraburkholderia susongensis TaxID=1515439 RepID=A0A1X7LPX4_9BURK|nr:SDR family oxidoreductase [Paraburkholderia susongensis]SMG55567.1 NAD(P)-dependent dehydrogenase, short-chain alcohol dehydrogenase family [Paraburkholderia susongensis]